MTAITDFFVSGNPLCMSALTLLLALVFLAAWKAPAWVRNIGLISLACGFLFGAMGLYQMYGVLQESYRAFNEAGDISPIIYGISSFIVSQIAYLCQKPRI